MNPTTSVPFFSNPVHQFTNPELKMPSFLRLQRGQIYTEVKLNLHWYLRLFRFEEKNGREKTKG